MSAPIRSEEVPASSEAPSPTNGVISALLTKVFAPTERHESLSFMSDVYLCVFTLEAALSFADLIR
jgi:hypothetical protein